VRARSPAWALCAAAGAAAERDALAEARAPAGP